MAYNFRAVANTRQKSLNRRIHQLEHAKALANYQGNIKLANKLTFQIRALREKMGDIAYGKA